MEKGRVKFVFEESENRKVISLASRSWKKHVWEEYIYIYIAQYPHLKTSNLHPESENKSPINTPTTKPSHFPPTKLLVILEVMR